jgi:hypothetical protein
MDVRMHGWMYQCMNEWMNKDVHTLLPPAATGCVNPAPKIDFPFARFCWRLATLKIGTATLLFAFKEEGADLNEMLLSFLIVFGISIAETDWFNEEPRELVVTLFKLVV